MALIKCPRCHKRISSQATTCRHCGFTPGIAGDGANRRSYTWHFIAATLLAALGALIFVFHAKTGSAPPLMAASSPYLMGAGGVWYVVARIAAWIQ